MKFKSKADAKRFLEQQKNIGKARDKAELGLYLTTNHVFSYSNKGITDYLYTAVRGIGKTVIALEVGKILKDKYGYDNVKIFYFRLTDNSIKEMLKNHADKAVDPYLIDKYKMEISCKSNIVYDHGKPFIEFYPLVSAGSKGKGVNLYDCNFFNKRDKDGNRIKTFIVTIWDEFLMAEGIEKKSVGDPVEQYKIYKEAILRDAEVITEYNAVYNFLLANNVSECASVTGALYNYIPSPDNHRRVKLTRKRAMFWNVPITQKYIEKRKKSYNANIFDYENDPNYADVERDLSLIKKKKTRIVKVTQLLKFDKFNKKKWFCVYDGKYIRQYRNETLSKSIIVPMKRYLDEIYNVDLINSIFQRYDAKDFMYVDIMSMALFQAQLKLLKTK